jgi:hypothetical protein
MARPLRLDIEDGWYHVINRGLEKRQIFPDERANTHFLELMSVLPTRFGLKIHSYGVESSASTPILTKDEVEPDRTLESGAGRMQ